MFNPLLPVVRTICVCQSAWICTLSLSECRHCVSSLDTENGFERELSLRRLLGTMG